MIKNENGKHKILWNDVKIAIPMLDVFYREQIQTLEARVGRLERKVNNNGVDTHEK